jgi:hypothetical protein
VRASAALPAGERTRSPGGGPPPVVPEGAELDYSTELASGCPGI